MLGKCLCFGNMPTVTMYAVLIGHFENIGFLRSNIGYKRWCSSCIFLSWTTRGICFWSLSQAFDHCLSPLVSVSWHLISCGYFKATLTFCSDSFKGLVHPKTGYFNDTSLHFTSEGLYLPPGAEWVTFMMDGCTFFGLQNLRYHLLPL